jgi:hypothetical protein
MYVLTVPAHKWGDGSYGPPPLEGMWLREPNVTLGLDEAAWVQTWRHTKQATALEAFTSLITSDFRVTLEWDPF